MRLGRATTTLAATLTMLAAAGASAQTPTPTPAAPAVTVPADSNTTVAATTAPATPAPSAPADSTASPPPTSATPAPTTAAAPAGSTTDTAAPAPAAPTPAAPAPVAPATTAPSITPPATTPPATTAATPASPAAKPADPVVARVNGEEIHLSEINEAGHQLPEQYQKMPANVLYPLLVDQAIDRVTMADMARKQDLEKDPLVARALAHAEEVTLQNALISREVGPQITEAAIHAEYDKTVAGKTGEEEVHARHILVSSEADAVKIIAELKKGADFATLAKARSSDPGAATGGDLGWFKKADMLPAFSAAAFALKPGQITDKPVHTQYGWHVIKVEGRRASPAPTFAEVHDDLRQKLIQDAVQRVLAESKVGVSIERYNPDGSPLQATNATTPAAPDSPAAAKATK
jgi:peptidyl-prolyl cis-trans isomerase C